MKKVFAIAFVLICTFFYTGVTAFADCGPKDSLTVYVNGVEEGREYYIALLSDMGSQYNPDEYTEKQTPEWNAFYKYSLSDEYYLYDNFGSAYYKMMGSGSHRWGYRPPERFKIMLYFPDDGSITVSNKLEKYAFNSYFTADVNGSALDVEQNGGSKGYMVEISGFLFRVIITVLLELGVAKLFGIRSKRAVKLILIVNVITQLLLNIAVAAADISRGSFGAAVALVGMEIVIFITEAAIYANTLPGLTEGKINGGRAAGYAFAANAASLVVGGILLMVFYLFSDIVMAM